MEFCNPRARIRVLAITTQDYKQIISQDIVGYCIFFLARYKNYPNLTYDVWGIKYISLNLVRYAV